MNINKNVSFKSGLSRKNLIQERFANPQHLQKTFTEKYGVEANFSHNKSMAYANLLCAQIFEMFQKKLNNFFKFPPFIAVYNKKNLVDINSAPCFCIPDTKEVLKNDYPYPGRSLFFSNKYRNLSEINDITEAQFRNHRTSSSHFLAPFIHEWLHSFHLNYIYSHLGYGGNCEYMQTMYPSKNSERSGYELLKALETKKLSRKDNEVIYDTLGEYSTFPLNQYLEIFSESFTKFICNSLKGTTIMKNPIEELKNTSVEFQEILRKILKFE